VVKSDIINICLWLNKIKIRDISKSRKMEVFGRETVENEWKVREMHCI